MASMSAVSAKRSSEGTSMDGMTGTPAHAKPARRDLLWALVAILACGLLEVWASWLQIGAVSGFPKLGRMTTGWILPVTTEFYWIAALQAWLVDPAGPRSRVFAMWSAGGVFALSLAGQESDHLLAAAGRTVPPAAVVGFVTALPLVAVALIAILIHLRQKDREDAAAAQREDGAEDERAVLRAEIAAVREELSAAQSELGCARQQAGETAARNEVLTRRLAAAAGSKRARKPAAKRGAPAPATRVPRNVDVQAEALAIIAAEPGITGEELAARVGRSERWGQTFKKNLAPAAPKGQDPEE